MGDRGPTVSKSTKSLTILYADDDQKDRMLAKDALAETRLAYKMAFVADGEELMDYLHRRGRFAELAGSPLPGLILLGLNMPKKDGREALQEIKSDPRLGSIPIVVLTTSKAEEDIFRADDLGVNSIIVKPVTFQSLVNLTLALSRYQFEMGVAQYEAGETAVGFLEPADQLLFEKKLRSKILPQSGARP